MGQGEGTMGLTTLESTPGDKRYIRSHNSVGPEEEIEPVLGAGILFPLGHHLTFSPAP